MSSLLSKAKIGVGVGDSDAAAMQLLLKDNFSFLLGDIGMGMFISAQYQNLCTPSFFPLLPFCQFVILPLPNKADVLGRS
jgi:hypothetical protein